MDRRTGSNATDTFKSDWRRWTAIVELIARTGSAHHALDRREYQALYQRLITASRELAGAVDEAARSVYQKVEATVRPWMAPQVLERADGEILGDLLDRCRRIDQELGGRNRIFPRALTRVFLFIAASAVAFAILWTTQSQWSQLVALQDGARGLWHSFLRSGDLEKILAFGVLAILFSIYNISRTARV